MNRLGLFWFWSRFGSVRFGPDDGQQQLPGTKIPSGEPNQTWFRPGPGGGGGAARFHCGSEPSRDAAESPSEPVPVPVPVPVMELFDAGVKGRGLRASRGFGTGEVLLAEPGYAAVVNSSLSSQVCHSCFRRRANLLRCAQCRFAHYCNRTCQTAGWDGHRQECGAIRRLGGAAPNEDVRLAGRLLWRCSRDQGLAWDTQLLDVVQLEDNLGDMPEDRLDALKTDVQTFLRFWSCGSKRHPVDVISHVLGLIKANGLAVPDQRGLRTVGLGLFPNLSLVNHDCWPNCTATFNHGNQSAVSSALHSPPRMELRALRGINPGDELTVSYLDVLDASADRRRRLKERFHFDCGCERCSRHVGDDLMAAAAAEAKPDAVKEVSAFSKDTLDKVEDAQRGGDNNLVLQLCQECLEKQQDVLAETHLDKLRVLSVLVEALSRNRRFPEAAAYARKMVEGYRKLCQPNDPQLGLTLLRSGVAHWLAGQLEVGHKAVCESYRVAMVTHGPNHAVTRDLEAIRTQTELELKNRT